MTKGLVAHLRGVALGVLFAMGLLPGGVVVRDQVGLTSATSEVLFSPKGNVQARIKELLAKATTSCDVAMFDFTSIPLALSLIEIQKNGIKVRVLGDQLRAENNEHTALRFLSENGVKVMCRKGKGGGILHHKFAIIDDRVIITGSYNWTKAAEERNSENLTVTVSDEWTKKYRQEFDLLWSTAKPVPAPKRPKRHVCEMKCQDE